MKLISQGAEAKIYLNKNIITKNRTAKGYRHKDLDTQIRTRRTKSESKILTKALSIKANVPKVISSDKYTIQIQYIEGDRLSETLNNYPEEKQFKVMQQLGKQVALLHQNNIIHGDLTTSNIILSKSQTPNPKLQQPGLTTSNVILSKQSNSDSDLTAKRSNSEAVYKTYIIDFGLGFVSTKQEDKAVDLHLIKQALEAKHFQNHQALFNQFLKTYKNKETIERLKVVEKRGRYKH